MGVDPSDCVVIEDAPVGLQAAKAAGMYAIGYLGGSHVPHTLGLNADQLKAAGASVVITNHADLMQYIPL
jgi:beta-phosphoglucomutase-like phosphatase (HAD superfamily)